MKKLIVLVIIAIITTPLVFFMITNKTESINSPSPILNDTPSPIKKYNNNIYIDQQEIQLNSEVTQYQITFHNNDTINISIQMILQQTGTDFQPMASLLMLTDGNKSLLENKTMFFLLDIPMGAIIDTNILGHRISLGGKLLNKLFSKTRFHIGISCYYTKDIKVKNNDTWFLTLAETDNIHKQILTTSLKSKHPSMEITQIDRHNNMGFYTSANNDFDGKYFGFKFIPYLPFGLSIAKNLKKEITTTNGSIIYFTSAFHRKGQISIETQGETATNNKKNSATIIYCGNQTGTFKFSASGVGFPWKHFVTLFYVDIDPHIRKL